MKLPFRHAAVETLKNVQPTQLGACGKGRRVADDDHPAEGQVTWELAQCAVQPEPPGWNLALFGDSNVVVPGLAQFPPALLPALTLDQWRQQHFQSPANSGPGANLNDFDGDGLVNLLEYALGDIPVSISSNTRPTVEIETIGGGDYQTMTVLKPPYVTGMTYTVETSGDLSAWLSGAGHSVVLTENAAILKVRDANPLSTSVKRFIRLRVTVL